MPVAANYHGVHQEVHVGKFSTNRYGVVSGSIQRHLREDFDQPQWQYLSVNSAPPGIAPVSCVNAEREYVQGRRAVRRSRRSISTRATRICRGRTGRRPHEFQPGPDLSALKAEGAWSTTSIFTLRIRPLEFIGRPKRKQDATAGFVAEPESVPRTLNGQPDSPRNSSGNKSPPGRSMGLGPNAIRHAPTPPTQQQ
jgi:hypothetical protein